MIVLSCEHGSMKVRLGWWRDWIPVRELDSVFGVGDKIAGAFEHAAKNWFGIMIPL